MPSSNPAFSVTESIGPTNKYCTKGRENNSVDSQNLQKFSKDVESYDSIEVLMHTCCVPHKIATKLSRANKYFAKKKLS
jgi:hypothetical protein